MKKTIVLLLFALVLASCKTETKKDSKAAEPLNEEISKTDDWIYLFDGKTTTGWRAYNGDALPPGWVVKDGVLTFDTELGLEQD